MNQGDICWYKFKEPNKQRPVLILTRSDLIPSLNSVTVAEITTTIRDNDAELWLDENDGMPERCTVNFVNIQTVPKAKVGSKITNLPKQRMFEVRAALDFIFDLERV